jgi:hypothetical protein
MSSHEAVCRFVSSRGLLKSCNVYSQNPKSSCPTDLAHVEEFIWQQNSGLLPPRDSPVSIYVCCDAFQTFINDYASQINVPFIIVCGDGDQTMFRETISREKLNMFVMFMLNTNLRGLFSQNMDIQECRHFLTEKIEKLWAANATIFKSDDAPKTLEYAIETVLQKLRQIPIGLDYHTISANPRHPWISATTEGTTPVEQETVLIEQIRSVMKPFYQRKIRIYSNVMLCPDRFNDRVDAIRMIPSVLISQQSSFLSRTQTWKNMTEYAFVLSPFGNGMDCHRTWEALLCGCIPIVRSSVFDELFEGLPVLIVNNWSDISLPLLVTTITRFKDNLDNNELKYEKLELSYYTKWFSNN